MSISAQDIGLHSATRCSCNALQSLQIIAYPFFAKSAWESLTMSKVSAMQKLTSRRQHAVGIRCKPLHSPRIVHV